MKILVTGATGKLGSKVVDSLLKSVPPSDLVVSVRSLDKAEGLRARGVEVRQGDFDDLETLDHAFTGIDRLLIISADGDNDTRIRQHSDAVAAAERAGVKFIAYTSLTNAQESKNTMAPTHKATEQAILKTGIPYSFLRNNWYLENEISGIEAVLAGAPWVTSAGNGKVGWALQQDYAEAAATVLSEKWHENTVYEFSGKSLTQEEFVAILSSVIGKEITVQQVDDTTYTDSMKNADLPDFVISILVEIQRSIREDTLDFESNDFEKVLGRPATPVNKALKQLVHTISQTK